MFETLTPVLYPIALIITFIFPLGGQFHAIWWVMAWSYGLIYEVQRHIYIYGTQKSAVIYSITQIYYSA